MITASNPTAVMSIDFKKNRIRIHKSMLHLLGDPTYIQLLINPSSMMVGVRRVDTPLSGEPVHKITKRRMQSDNSYEIYSQVLLSKLLDLVPSMECGGRYHIKGNVIASKGIAFFSLKTPCRIERENDIYEQNKSH